MKRDNTSTNIGAVALGMAVLSRHWDDPKMRTLGIIIILFMLAVFMTVDWYFSDPDDK